MIENVISMARDHFGSDRRVRVCWLRGPLAHHLLTPHQEVELGVVVRPDHYDEFVDEIEAHIEAISRPVSVWHYNWGQNPDEVYYVQAVLEGAQYLDVAIHRTDLLGPQPEPVVLLFTRDVELELQPPRQRPEELEQSLKRFWLGAALAVAQISRGDRWLTLDFLKPVVTFC